MWHLIAYGALLIGVGIAITLFVAQRRWTSSTARRVAQIASRSSEEQRNINRTTSARTSHTQIEELPVPVQRYLRFAVPDGTPFVQFAEIAHEGEFSMKRDEWSTFTSAEYFRVRLAAFVWDATIRFLPGINVRVRDSYANENGSMRAAISALVTVAHVHNTPEIASAALARFLAELPWIPTALIPGFHGAGVAWTAIDDNTAAASITDASVSVMLRFHFAPDGRIVRVSGLRYRDVDGVGVLTQWCGTFSDYERVHGVMIPMTAEVAWILPDGEAPYWRGRIVSVRYD